MHQCRVRLTVLYVCPPPPVKNEWSVLDPQGALVQGGYGHSSAYDPHSRSIFIHGGYKAFSANKYGLAGDLYRYDVDKNMWCVDVCVCVCKLLVIGVIIQICGDFILQI